MTNKRSPVTFSAATFLAAILLCSFKNLPGQEVQTITKQELAVSRHDRLRGEEKLNLIRAESSEEAFNEARSSQLWQVQKGWEQPVPRRRKTIGPITDAFTKDATGTARIT